MKKFYKKIYNAKIFEGLEDLVIERIEFINKYSKEIDSLAETVISINDNQYHYQQIFITNKEFHELPKNEITNHLKKLSHDLDRISELGFIHGDLNKKNILFNGQKFVLIDLEPCLKQIINGKKKLMFTIPYWSLNDMRKNKITTETDKIGFYSFCKWAYNKSFTITNTLEKFRNRQKSDYQLFSVNENSIINISFLQIVDLVHNHKGV